MGRRLASVAVPGSGYGWNLSRVRGKAWSYGGQLLFRLLQPISAIIDLIRYLTVSRQISRGSEAFRTFIDGSVGICIDLGLWVS
jgi:hypothetical protein